MTIDTTSLAAIAPRAGKPASVVSPRAAGSDRTTPVPAPTDTVTLSDDATNQTGGSPKQALSPIDGGTQGELPTVDELRAAFMTRPGSDNWNKHVDLNQDGVVNFGDLAMLRERMAAAEPVPQPTVDDMRNAFLSTSGDGQWNPNADLNGDGQVNFADLAALRQSMAPAAPDVPGTPDDPAAPELTVSDIRASFLASADSDNWNAAADLDGDGRVNFADLAMLRARMDGEG